jgi:predicted RNase H-like HicB family nuclease
MKLAHYTVLIEPEDDGGYHAFCPALSGCHTQGDTIEEALENIKEAVELYLESLKAHGEKPPVDNYYIKPLEVSI